MSVPIEKYDLSNLANDVNKYLNKFVPMQLPFSINGFLTPLKLPISDTITALAINENTPVELGLFKSHLLLTPLDFNPDVTFDLISKNQKFINNLFSADSINQVVRQQKSLDTQNLASTLVLANPTMLPLNKQSTLNVPCVSNATVKRHNPKGAFFYTPTYPGENVTVLPYVLYEEGANCTKCNIPASVVTAALENYCKNYQGNI
jgi:hypothetical protein